jgi:hypothetical protein
VLALLAGYYAWHQRKEVPAREAKEAAAKRFLPIPPEAEIVSVEVKNGTGEIALERRDPDGWRLVRPLDARADEDEARTLTEALRDLQVLRRPQGDVGAPAYGLVPPAAGVSLKPKEGEAIAFEVGAKAPLGDGYYARLAGASELLVVGSGAERAVSLAADRLRDRRAVRLNAWGVERLRLERPSGTIALQREADGGWMIHEPIAFAADRDAVRELVDDLCGLRAAAFAEGTAFAPPAATVVLGASQGGTDERVEIGAAPAGKGPRYVRRADGSVIEIGESALRHLDAPLDEFRRRQVVGLDRWNTRQVEVTGEATATLEKDPSGSEWKLTAPAPRELTFEDAAALLDSLDAMKAESFLAAPSEAIAAALRAPRLRLRIEASPASEGTSAKTVEVAFAGPLEGHSYAQVTGVADLFVLGPNSIDLLGAAVTRVAQPPASPPPSLAPAAEPAPGA